MRSLHHKDGHMCAGDEVIVHSTNLFMVHNALSGLMGYYNKAYLKKVCSMLDACDSSQIAAMRAALDEAGEREKRYIWLTNYCSGLCMAKVETIAQNYSGLEDMSVELRDMSDATGEYSKDLAEATYQAISAGVDTAKSVDFVQTSTELAVAGFTASADAVDVLTTAINAYGMQANDAESISDKLIVTQNLGKITVDQLAQYMGTGKAQLMFML